ncbi:Na+/H+ antiporter NhaA [Streptosporangium oxazolinicum]|uniref:Na(+)/H(+) antiporter NhaA n=1 Tax=Streptosporangium oxazolinicum TaxID=909287 RepID=A0ABP8BDZ2_9ACTN
MTARHRESTPPPARTVWAPTSTTPLRAFLRTETGSAIILLAAILTALAWANAAPATYEQFWRTPLSITAGGFGVSQDLRQWVNTGLMTFFFFVVGLEARREFDMGELRDRRRLALPLAAGAGGMIVPVVIYLGFNAGTPAAHGWGAAMSTDTAFALGMLALFGSHLPARLRTYLLTVTVVDDLLALAVIAIFYSEHVTPLPLLTAVAVFIVILTVRALGVRHGSVYALLGAAAWVALLRSGVEPVIIGLAMGLLTYASPASRGDLERATDLFRLFREQPTPALARSAQGGLTSAISPNERLQQLYHPWASYVVVPLFALSNAGITLGGGFLAQALASPITLGILLAYTVGKPAGIIASSWLVTLLSRGRVRPPVGWAAVTAGGAIAGIGFTVSLLIATLAFDGPQLQQAKFAILAAALCAPVITWAVARATTLLPVRLRIRALLGTADTIVDLAAPVDPDRDHLRGPADAPVTVIEYGDFECPYCGQAEPVVRRLLADLGDVRYVWRHLPLTDVHPFAQLAAQAGEAAAAQGAFWQMHDRLLAHQDRLRPPDLIDHARDLGLDVGRFRADLHDQATTARIAEDVDSADVSGVAGTPTFFVNGRRHHGAFDLDSLSSAIRSARARAGLDHRQG